MSLSFFLKDEWKIYVKLILMSLARHRIYFTIVHCSKEKDDVREEEVFSHTIVLRFIDINSSCVEYFVFFSLITSYDIMFRAICRISCCAFIGGGKKRKKEKKSWNFPFTFPWIARNIVEKSYEIDVRFIRTVESHLSISMAVLVVRSKFNPARKSRILIGGYNFAADRRCFSHPSSSVSPFEN